MLPSADPLPVLDCALYTATHFYTLTTAQLAMRLRQGNYEPIPYMGTLFQLMRLIRLGVCQKTRTLQDDELPPLLDLLGQLPPYMQHELEQAIEAERRGECYHGPHAQISRERVMQEWTMLTSATGPQQPQSRGQAPAA